LFANFKKYLTFVCKLFIIIYANEPEIFAVLTCFKYRNSYNLTSEFEKQIGFDLWLGEY